MLQTQNEREGGMRKEEHFPAFNPPAWPKHRGLAILWATVDQSAEGPYYPSNGNRPGSAAFRVLYVKENKINSFPHAELNE
ncbi:hypothetical protein Ddc_01098 [Ditylenchus destructor]|nr:hypothetical protein Ddc_01098 [Ditylenchus destructor]